MRRLAAVAASLAIAVSGAGVPSFAAAQSQGDYGRDPCQQAKHDAAFKGTILGGILGAIFGSQVSGHGARAEGSVVGGVAGAVAGAQIARHSVKCLGYPRGVAYHRPNCRWVEEDQGDGVHDFEVCQDRDGVWRPSGRG